MKIQYRKNENWGSVVIQTDDISNLDELISNKLEEKFKGQDIVVDIVDVQIMENTHYTITVFYALVPSILLKTFKS
jgi:hypothetical protein